MPKPPYLAEKGRAGRQANFQIFDIKFLPVTDTADDRNSTRDNLFPSQKAYYPKNGKICGSGRLNLLTGQEWKDVYRLIWLRQYRRRQSAAFYRQVPDFH